MERAKAATLPWCTRFGATTQNPYTASILKEDLLAHIQLFLSTVSTEFKSYREALRRNLNLPDVTIQIQEDFIAGGVPTLEKLDLYIRECDAVIHLVGDSLGSLAKPRSLAYLSENYPNLARHLPPLGGFLAADGPSLSYTQWEAWLALLHGRKLLICVPTPEAPREEGFTSDTQQQLLQQQHLARLRGFEAYPEVNFRSIDHLTWQIQSSLFLELRTAAGQIHRPTTLPYTPLGELLKGRDGDLQKLQQQLGPIPQCATTPSSAVVLTGMGGVGKTRLAIEHAWRNAARHCAVLFSPASTPATLNRTFAALTAVLDLPDKDATEEAVQRQAVINWLSSHPGWLLILDNVDTEAAASAVESLFPQISGGQVVITTRLRNWSGAVPLLDVDVLQPEDAVNFLLERTVGKRRVSEDDHEAAQAIAADLGFLALALEQAGAYISKRRFSFASYRSEWEKRRAEVVNWNDPRITKYPTSLSSTWLTSYEQLSQDARQLLRRLSWLSPEPIPESLLSVKPPSWIRKLLRRLSWLAPELIPESLLTVKPPSWIEKVSKSWSYTLCRCSSVFGGETHQNELMLLLYELDGLSLVTRSPYAPQFTMHTLVQEITRLRQEQFQEPLELNAALTWIDTAFTGDPSDVRSWTVLEPLESHAKNVAKFAAEAGIARPTGRLFNQVGLFLLNKALFGEAEEMARCSLSVDEGFFGPGHPEVAKSLNNLASILYATNRMAEAEPLLRRSLAINENWYGQTHPRVAIDLNNISMLLLATDQLEESEALMRRSLAISETAHGNDHPKVALALNNLVGLLMAANRLEEAECLIRRSLAINIASYDPDHTKVALGLSNLAGILMLTNQHEEAEPMLRRALAIDEASYGLSHPRVAVHLNKLSWLLRANSRLEEAEPLMRRALQIDEVAYGQESSNVAEDLRHLAELLKATNRLPEAERLVHRAAAIDKENNS